MDKPTRDEEKPKLHQGPGSASATPEARDPSLARNPPEFSQINASQKASNVSEEAKRGREYEAQVKPRNKRLSKL